MTDLDALLRSILLLPYRYPKGDGATMFDNKGDVPIVNKQVAQIKQAFNDAGYVKTDVKAKADHLLQNMVNMHARMNFELLRLGLTPTPTKPKSKLFKDMESAARDHGYMTGQEAFERVKAAGLLGHDLETAREALCD